jgi:hypothetical protein
VIMIRKNVTRMLIWTLLLAGVVGAYETVTAEDALCTPICAECSGCIDEGCCFPLGACGGNECVKISEESCRCILGG